MRIEEYELALKEWEETKPPGSASSADPFGHYKKKFEERESSRQSEIDAQSVKAGEKEAQENGKEEEEEEEATSKVFWEIQLTETSATVNGSLY
ncbi:hypothetical protein NECAME_02655 [Necator americanus]|uniref:Uncharacterized protein n=1 Tax=Necator americanus TaxID=51031 RepID=W2TCA4_NECAM|nr:hypothetical protein NECAME_02655 [Necator americanus]ETN79229.1 hypothetical protein NECAME_02655 [Necator americanus]